MGEQADTGKVLLDPHRMFAPARFRPQYMHRENYWKLRDRGEKALSVYYAFFRPELERLKRSTDRDREKAVKLGLIPR